MPNVNTIEFFNADLFSGLKELTEFSMPYLDMYGYISPSFIEGLQKLEYLNLSHNKLVSQLPNNGWSKNLQIIELNDNQFYGSIPVDWTSFENGLPRLEYVSLSNTNMGSEGEFKIQVLWGSQALKAVDMSSCEFSGDFPSEYFEPEFF